MLKLLKKQNILIFFILFFLIVMFSNSVYATDSVMQGAEDFLSKGNEELLNQDNIKKASDSIYNAFLAVGTVIVVIVGAVLGLQFILGSAEEKAKVQEALIPFVIGSIVIFGAFGIWKIVYIVLRGL